MVIEVARGARPSRVEARRARVRHELASYAIRLAGENGFENTTVEDIARAAEYHPSSFFRYFASKEDAVFLGLPEATADFRDECAGVITSNPDGWAAARAALVRAVTRWTERDPDLFEVQFRLWTTDPALQAPLAGHFVEWARIITAGFGPADTGSDADLYAHLVGGALISTLRAAVESGALGTDQFARRVDAACEMLAAGLRTPPAERR